MYEILPKKISSKIQSKEEKIVKTLYKWLKWQILLCISIFITTFIWLLVIKLFWVDIDKIFQLSLIAWLMEFVPYVWPFIAILPAIAIALWLWFKSVVIVLILYIIIQQIENNILVPYIMWKTLSLSPFSVLIAMIIWASLFWIIWIIIAIPVVSIIKIFASK
jgi:predicted PurR-regulated permease PerM